MLNEILCQINPTVFPEISILEALFNLEALAYDAYWRVELKRGRHLL